MLNGWIIYSECNAKRNEAFIARFFEKAELYQIHLTLMYREHFSVGISDEPTVIVQGRSVLLPDFVIMRTIAPPLSRFFEAAHIPVFNSYAVAQTANHKFLTHLEMKAIGIPQLPTYCFTNQQLLQAQNFPLPYPFICKKCSGRGGQDVYWIHAAADLKKLPALQRKSDWIIQPPAPILGQDLRVFVIGKEIIGAILRKNNKDFRANFSLSQTAAWYKLKENETQLIQKIIQHFDLDFVGLDFLSDHAGNLLFNEMEDVVGSRTLSIYSDIDVVDLYFKHIRKSIIKKKNAANPSD